MPVFRYTVVDAAAATRKGELSADSARAARGQLHDRGWVLLDLAAVRERGNPLGFLSGRWRRQKPSCETVLPSGARERPVRMKPAATLFLRELSTLLQVGVGDHFKLTH